MAGKKAEEKEMEGKDIEKKDIEKKDIEKRGIEKKAVEEKRGIPEHPGKGTPGESQPWEVSGESEERASDRRDVWGTKYDAVIFDLDGTLLDTLSDLTNSVNAMMNRYGLEQYTREQVRSFVGNGIRKLICRVLPGGEHHPRFQEIYEGFRQYYGAHCMDETEPYPGIPSLLDGLKKEGVRTAIVSNKADFAVKKLSRVYFGSLIGVAIGEKEGIRKKPAPDTVDQALEELGVDRTRAVYIGDSDVDLETARNAGMDVILVSWGFRSREFLLAHGASGDRIAANVREVRSLLSGQPV